MNVAVFDTCVPKKKGGYMHFDIIVEAGTAYEQVLVFALEYLRSKAQPVSGLSCKECRFCHLEAVIPAWNDQILRRGYCVHEIAGCH